MLSRGFRSCLVPSQLISFTKCPISDSWTSSSNKNTLLSFSLLAWSLCTRGTVTICEVSISLHVVQKKVGFEKFSQSGKMYIVKKRISKQLYILKIWRCSRFLHLKPFSILSISQISASELQTLFILDFSSLPDDFLLPKKALKYSQNLFDQFQCAVQKSAKHNECCDPIKQLEF